ncbi:Vitamin K-dependent gamma-carboxylase [Polystyrenella longa]|uniref:Vitamin K-dependent gamma-carboxylase n=1 Tax=Polystyrenella longa TaxID=2528007 RepID=A0A518CR06_9PLAN|nr:HTTM domain-containing protein [Polystyrenella longa]QDU81645.1 Vitamin K-dependent gamma-carboxylase [Polystyrenella longa]
MKMIQTERKSIVQELRDFFHKEEVPFGLALIRMALPFVLFLTMAIRWTWSRELYSSDGAPAPLAIGFGYHDFLPLLPGSVIVALHTLMLFGMICCMIGWRTRVSLIITGLIYTYLCMFDVMSTMTKYSVISSHMFFILSLSNCGAVWSVDSWLEKRKAKQNGVCRSIDDYPRFPLWPQRLIQLMIALVYFGAAVTKFHTAGYFNGDQMHHWMNTNINNANPVGELLTLFPGFVLFSAYLAILWEILFIGIVWTRWGRIIAIGIGTSFHAMTTLILGLYIFPLICFCAYLAFITEEDVQRVSYWWRKKVRSREWSKMVSSWGSTLKELIPSPAKPVSSVRSQLLFTAVATLIVTGGVFAEHQRDLYQVRSDSGPLPLRELDRDYVEMMLGSANDPITEKDKLFSFEVGTMKLGPRLVYQQYNYEIGDSLIAQCYLNPPHADMWLECNLHDAHDNLVDRVKLLVSRDQNVVDFNYTFGESVSPGNYDLVVMSKGDEIARKRISVGTQMEQAAAN